MNTHTIYHQLRINAKIEDVFNAVSAPEHLINWWPLKCYGTAQKGAEYNFFFGEPYDWYGLVTECLPNKSFHITMSKSDPDWDGTTFGFDLIEMGDQTLVDFSHANWPMSNDHFKKSSFCWALLLNGLKDYVENDVIIPFEDRA